MNRRFSIPREELHFTYARSSGSGGQNVNKVNSKAVLRWNAAETLSLPAEVKHRFLSRFGGKLTSDGEIVITSERHRDQGRNASDCLEKLHEMIQSVAVAPKKRKATRPTFGSKQRRLKSKKEHSEKKQNRRLKLD